ncbi:high mobility group nucleosome-binding domain-containing protein 5-like [Vitis riparia]|uniref:high mobility group nucleosome-binding domain-containing protein 5-like n=1 Tax=Vitis riparia TaxID=96939 RepID=UPI00155A98C3|nr:high mobility group nucleosome-binding domain-containing protein 5-like [Vitis riparia]
MKRLRMKDKGDSFIAKITRTSDQDQEQNSEKGKCNSVEAEPISRWTGFSGREVLVVTDVFDGGEGEGEALGEMDATDDGEGDEAVEEGHEAGDAKDEEGGGSGETRDIDLGEGEKGVGDGDDNDGLHGLDRHWDAEEKAGGDVVETHEDKGCGEVQVFDQCES